MHDTLGVRAQIVYMVRNPIERMLSHYLHNVGGGYETRPIDAGAQRPRLGLRRAQPLRDAACSRTCAAFDRNRVLVVANEDLAGERAATMRRVYEFCGVDDDFESEQFAREWETGSGKQDGGFRLMDRAVRLPGLRALDRNFDRLPESLRWIVERVVHDPGEGPAPKPELDPEPASAARRARRRRRRRSRKNHRAIIRMARVLGSGYERIHRATDRRPGRHPGR